jgi:multicomponent Na+:H+ antiporter subunit E
MPYAVSLWLVLMALWLALSGMLETHLVALGALSSALVVAIALRMNVVDHEGHPIHLHPARVLAYFGWLALEIVKSNLDVARRILDPSLPIGPTVVRLPCSQDTDLGRVIYANSITLTPGTVSIDLDESHVTVHALTPEGAEALAGGEMDARVSALEGR